MAADRKKPEPMKTPIIYPGIPGPDRDPQTEEESTPELPERERKHGVEAVRAGLMAVALLATSLLFAQNAPAGPNTTPKQTPATTPRTSTQQPVHTQTNKGWTMFNEDVGTRLDLKADQLKRLQDVDRRYQDRYADLGATPWTAPGYAPLTRQRNADIQAILTPEQFKEYTSTYGGQPSGTAPRKPAGRTGTTTPPTGKQ
jgi:hypothetical protein